VVRCEHSASDEEVRQAVWRAIDLVGGLDQHFASRNKIVIKANMTEVGQPRYLGRIFTLTDAHVIAGVVSWLRRASPRAEIVILGNFYPGWPVQAAIEDLGYAKFLAECDVKVVDGDKGALTDFAVPGGGIMFSRYRLPAILAEADAIVSVAHMKSHVAAGVTLTLKNLFGWPPMQLYGRPRRYLHAPVRLPRVLADLGLILRPSLCVIDGLVAANRSEWGGDPLRMDCILAGDNAVATDATGARLMGIDPEAEYPSFPYMFDSNTLLQAARAGLGPVSADQIEVVGDPVEPLMKRFHVDRRRSAGLVHAVRRDTCMQALLYRERHEEFLADYGGRYIGLVDGQVIFNEPDLSEMRSRGRMMSGQPERAFFLKYVEPADSDLEHYEVYERILGGAE